MTLPCLDHHDMTCHLPQLCRYGREVRAMVRDPGWVEEHDHCAELKARREGWEEVASQ